MTSITLCMIVKNEAHCIKDTFDSVHQYINYYVIIDTGSTDNTKEVITTYFDALGIKGEIHDRPWKNFGWNRTEAFKYAKNKGDYVWVIDADDLVEGKFSLPDVMIHDSYALIYGNSVSDGHVSQDRSQQRRVSALVRWINREDIRPGYSGFYPWPQLASWCPNRSTVARIEQKPPP